MSMNDLNMKNRIDNLLVDRGFVESRSKAQRLVMAAGKSRWTDCSKTISFILR